MCAALAQMPPPQPPQPPPPQSKPLPKGMTELRLHNYLKRSVSTNTVNRGLLINAHNWIVSNQMPVSDPNVHDLLSQCFTTIHSPAAAGYHARRASQLRNAAAQPVATNHVAPTERRVSSNGNRAPVSADGASTPDDHVREASSQNLLKRARSRSRFSTQQGAAPKEAPVKRTRLQADVQPAIQQDDVQPAIQQTDVQYPAHVHDSQPCDGTNYMPSLQRALQALKEECRENGAAPPTVCYSHKIDDEAKQMTVSIHITADVPKLAKKATDGMATTSAHCRFGSADNITEGGPIYVKARNRAARLARSKVEHIKAEIETACLKELRIYVQRLLMSWRATDLKRYCYRAFHNAKEMILREGKGNLYGASVSLYGSLTTGLVLGESDIDVSVKVPALFRSNRDEDAHLMKAKTVEVLKYLASHLRKERMENVFVVTQARVPVLRYMDRETQVHVDVTLNNDRSLLLSRLLRRHVQKDARIWELCMLVKYWAKQRRLCGVPQGHINSMGWVIMVIFFTQHLAHPRIGGLFRPKRTCGNFSTIVEEPWRYSSARDGVNDSATHVLLMQFFRAFGCEFDFAREAISISLQRRESTQHVSLVGCDKALFIEQPLLRGKNVVDYVSRYSLQIVRDEMKAAYYMLKSGSEHVRELFRVRQSRPVDELFARR